MEQIQNYFTFDLTGIIILSVLFIAFIVQLFYYLFYYNKPVSYIKHRTAPYIEQGKLPAVSVIIVAKNESENLAKNLPHILEQKYPNFEVVVVNDGSTDESDYLLKSMKLQYTNLYHTFSPESEDLSATRQKILSLTIGIKAAKNDILLFTEADSAPLSDNWIRSMVSELDNNDIVIGYNKIAAKNGFWGKIAHFDNLLFSLQYLSKSIRNQAYTGVYSNVAYKKHLFFNNKGFSAFLNYDSAEQIFLNHLLNENKTSVALEHDSFVCSDIESFAKWKSIKSNYYKARRQFKNNRHKTFALETLSRWIFYITSITGLSYTIYTELWAYLAGFIVFIAVRYTIQVVVINNAAKHFQSKPNFIILPVLEIFQAIYNHRFISFSKKKYKR